MYGGKGRSGRMLSALAGLRQMPWSLKGMAPMAARRAHPAQRSSHQDLPGNPDACRPRRGSACNETTGKSGGNARSVFALPVRRTAAMSPRIGGPREGGAPRPFFPPHFFGKKWGRPPRRRALRGGASDERATTGRPYRRSKPSPDKSRADAIRPYRAGSSRPRSCSPLLLQDGAPCGAGHQLGVPG